ncbi:hypothetical protein [Porphyromonas loveana]|uniref:hypothetical protein n=1 Tax=Porphyromonas loveana TaxID=1884669 RepID=UPI0035A0868F
MLARKYEIMSSCAFCLGPDRLFHIFTPVGYRNLAPKRAEYLRRNFLEMAPFPKRICAKTNSKWRIFLIEFGATFRPIYARSLIGSQVSH